MTDVHKITRRTALIGALGTGVLLSGGPAFAGTPRFATAKSSNLGLQGYDTTGYFRANMARPGSDAHTVDWRGVTWRFESEEDAALFLQRPDYYAPQFGGYCTRAMSRQRLRLGDPEVWRIHNDKLYVFFRPVGGEKFDEDPDTMIAAAQAYWETLDLIE